MSLAEPRNATSGCDEFRQRRLGEVAGEQRRDRDAKLGAGELERELSQGSADGPRGGIALRGKPVDGRSVHGHQAELGGDEEGVSRGEGDEAQQRDERLD